MDDSISKRTAGQYGISRRGSSSFNDLNFEEGGSSRCANRIGCNTRLKSRNGAIGHSNLEKAKSLRPALHSSGSHVARGSSSESVTSRSNPPKLQGEQHNQTSLKETCTIEHNIRREKTHILERSQDEDSETVARQNFSVRTEEMGSSKASDATAPPIASKQGYGRSRLRGFDNPLGACTSVQLSRSPRNSNLLAKSFVSPSQILRTRGDRVRSQSSASGSGLTSGSSDQRKTANVIKGRRSDGESSSSKAKVTTTSISAGNLTSQKKNTISRPCLSAGASSSQHASRNSSNGSVAGDVAETVDMRRTLSINSRARVPARVNKRSSSHRESTAPRQLPPSEYIVSEPVEDHSCSNESSSTEFRPFRSWNRSLVISAEDHRRDDEDGLSELLIALERAEFELALETSMVPNDGWHDQHRGMRLDIDNMSYEELLALEERIGNVSTALSEEALSKCLKRSCYMPKSLPGLETNVRCSICQEEYVAGDEVGELGCEHGYHIGCIHDWLRLKNWCPICKAHAAAP